MRGGATLQESLSDEILLQKIANRDTDALEQLYDRYERPIYSFALRIVKDAMEAEEIVQELFVRIWNAASRIEIESNKGKISTWMFAITRNLAIDRLRKQGRQPEDSVEDVVWERLRSNEDSTELTVEHNLLGQQLKKEIEGLQSDQKQVLEWIYYMGYTQQEVADQHKIPLGTVKSRVRLALKALRGRFELWKEEVQYERRS
ncbi:RNA polymerase subunit sigma-24 [Paenibacillus sp. VTT E-133291]|nr:RNA polymerase subunit sigma-24 [Paenibacillus sp. VTT E-133291]